MYFFLKSVTASISFFLKIIYQIMVYALLLFKIGFGLLMG
ncbi:hypothetical protein SMA01_0632 [Salmonella enterica subsp. enterica serovar Manhattan str. 111113]|nr:hypothetical protein SMA01_0632 [Salmonella enterica subsp. enterica serovar Manhattan str. 111113]